MGDLGADVVKVEKPGGDPARNLGPFYADDPNSHGSLFWFAFNTSKRGVTLDIESSDGREVFLKLSQGADILTESFPPGYLTSLSLDHACLSKINPRLIVVSISPFGQSGPYVSYRGPDIVEWAMGGQMALNGDPDRPPFRISHHAQSYMHASADAAAGALVALLDRHNSGFGQHVDVSIQDSVAHTADNGFSQWDLDGILRKRGEDARGGNHRATRIWRCKDGYVSWAHGGNSRLTPSKPLLDWMKAEGFRDKYLEEFDWDRPNFNSTTQEEMDRIEEPTARFFLMHTKAELLDGAVKHNAMLYPVATTADMIDNIQLGSRGFWTELEHEEMDRKITYPGAFLRASECPIRISRRAPRIGEHNVEIYEHEIGMSRKELLALAQAGVI